MQLTREQQTQLMQKQLLQRLQKLMHDAIHRQSAKRPAEAFYDSLLELIDGRDSLFPGLVLTTRRNPNIQDHHHFPEGLVLNNNVRLGDLPY